MRNWNWRASVILLTSLVVVAMLSIIAASVAWYKLNDMQREAKKLRDELSHGVVSRASVDAYRLRAETLTLYARYLECEAQPWGKRSKFSHCHKEG